MAAVAAAASELHVHSAADSLGLGAEFASVTLQEVHVAVELVLRRVAY